MPPVYRQWAERLGEAGFAVLRYDKRFLTHPGIAEFMAVLLGWLGPAARPSPR